MVFYRSVKYLFFAFILVITSCEKDNPSEFSNVPQIEFVSLNPTIVTESQGPIYFTVSYTDGDGDLGENTPDVKNLFLKDLRNNIEYEYRLQQLAPDGSNIAIQGTFEIELNNTTIIDGSNEQTFSYEIRVIDRAGNQSNIIESTPLTVSN
jgi:hypothetical protein